MQRGFSLVELSIVLVILGLLTGGILAGQSLIRAAELRAVTTEYSRYATAVQTFRDKYFAIPGDMTNATAFWGKDNTNCAGNTGTAATPGTCNGNGDGIMGAAAAASTPGEMYGFWQQLALAGLIEGSYTGLAGSGALFHAVPGTNTPKSKLSNAGWGVQNAANYAGDTAAYAYDYGNTLQFGGAIANSWPLGATLKPEEAWNIDTKMDDGKPGTGRIVPYYWSTCTTSTTNIDYAGSYKLTDSSPQCALYFTKGF